MKRQVRPSYCSSTYPSYFDDAIVLLLKFSTGIVRLENITFITVLNKLYLIKFSVSTKFTVLNHVAYFCCFLFLIYFAISSAVLSHKSRTRIECQYIKFHPSIGFTFEI